MGFLESFLEVMKLVGLLLIITASFLVVPPMFQPLPPLPPPMMLMFFPVGILALLMLMVIQPTEFAFIISGRRWWWTSVYSFFVFWKLFPTSMCSDGEEKEEREISNLGPLEAHRFARNRVWAIDIDPPPFPANATSRVFVDLLLKPSEDYLKIWPHRY